MPLAVHLSFQSSLHGLSFFSLAEIFSNAASKAAAKIALASSSFRVCVKNAMEPTVAFDGIIWQVAERRKHDTLTLCTRLPKGDGRADILSFVKVEDEHTAEEVLVSADGPRAEQVQGIFPNTHLFEIIGMPRPSEEGEKEHVSHGSFDGDICDKVTRQTVKKPPPSS
jgi:hypothetical protein